MQRVNEVDVMRVVFALGVVLAAVAVVAATLERASEERKIVDSRRGAIAEHERASAGELSDALADTQRRVEQRLTAWSEDLERAQENLFDQLQRLVGRQRRLIEEAEERLAADAERLESESEAQREALVKLR